MSEEITRDMNARSFEERIFAEFASMRADFNARFDKLEVRMTTMETRLTSLEDKVDARLRETRPIWEAMQADLSEIKNTLIRIKAQLSEIVNDLLETRGRVAVLEKSERRPIA